MQSKIRETSLGSRIPDCIPPVQEPHTFLHRAAASPRRPVIDRVISVVATPEVLADVRGRHVSQVVL